MDTYDSFVSRINYVAGQVDSVESLSEVLELTKELRQDILRSVGFSGGRMTKEEMWRTDRLHKVVLMMELLDGLIQDHLNLERYRRFTEGKIKDDAPDGSGRSREVDLRPSHGGVA